MNDRASAMRIVRSVVTVVLLVLCFFSMLSVILAGALKSTVLDKENYISVVESPEFSQTMMLYLRDELESECLFYDLPFSVLDEALSVERITDFSRVYLENLYNSLVYGEEFAVPLLDATPFVRAVDSFFDTLPAEEKPFDVTAADTVGKELASLASSLLQGGMNDTYVKLGNRVFGHPLLHNMVRYIPAFVFALVFSIGILLLLSYKWWLYRLYTICCALGISAAIGFVPFWLLKRYDLTTRLVLAESPFKLYIDSVYYSLLNEAVRITGWVFGICTALVIVSVIIVSVFGDKGLCTQNVHTNGIDESV